LAKRTLQTRALHLPRAVNRSGSRCWVHTVATESSRVKKNQSDNRVSVQLDVQRRTIIQIQSHTKLNTRISQRKASWPLQGRLYQGMAFLPDDKHLLITTNAPGQTLQSAIQDIDDGSVACHCIEWTLHSVPLRGALPRCIARRQVLHRRRR
jgi:hypothetical protein